MYTREPQDCIVHEKVARSYHTSKNFEIVLYMGFGVRRKEKIWTRQSDVSAC